jgi:BioD-like phosphotransacetylase family protein
MSVLIVASSEPRAGRSVIAAALAYRLAREGAAVTLARLAGDDGAAHDAAMFAAIEELRAPAAPVAAADVAALTGDIVLEAPPGEVADLAKQLSARVLVVGSPHSPELTAPDDALAGRIVTRVPASDAASVGRRAGIIGVLAEDRVLAAPSLADITAAVDGEWLVRGEDSRSIDRVMIGTVASDAGSPYFGNRERTCVVTRFDKTDIQLAALLTELEAMVLTGGGVPSPYLVDRVRSRGDDTSLVHTALSTVAAVEAIEPLYGTSAFDGRGKMLRAVELLDAAGVTLPVPVA